MRELLQFKWHAIDWPMAFKVSAGFVVMLVLTEMTGETWLATALAAMFAWLANLGGGPLFHRVIGMAVFAVVGALITLTTGVIGLDLVPNVVAIAVIAFVCTYALRWGALPFMVGFAIICWAIYQPFLVQATSVSNVLGALGLGTAVVVILNVIGGFLWPEAKMEQAEEQQEGQTEAAPQPAGPDLSYIVAYSFVVAIVLVLTTWFGWMVLKTDPTMMAGGAYFIIGPDPRKTWVAGVARVLGLALGVLVGLGLAYLLGPGLLLTALMIIAAGVSFGAFAAHPGAWMFFFMVFIAMGWPGLDSAVFDQVVNERFFGEAVGIVLAMLGLLFLQKWQFRRERIR